MACSQVIGLQLCAGTTSLVSFSTAEMLKLSHVGHDALSQTSLESERGALFHAAVNLQLVLEDTRNHDRSGS